MVDRENFLNRLRESHAFTEPCHASLTPPTNEILLNAHLSCVCAFSLPQALKQTEHEKEMIFTQCMSIQQACNDETTHQAKQ